MGELSDGVQPVDLLDDHHELVSTEPDEQIGPADPGLKPPGQLLQHPVAGFMAPGIVDGFEVVQINHAHGNHAAVLPRTRDGVGQILFECITVWQPGERVVPGAVRLLALESAQAFFQIQLIQSVAQQFSHALAEFDGLRVERILSRRDEDEDCPDLAAAKHGNGQRSAPAIRGEGGVPRGHLWIPQQVVAVGHAVAEPDADRQGRLVLVVHVDPEGVELVGAVAGASDDMNPAVFIGASDPGGMELGTLRELLASSEKHLVGAACLQHDLAFAHQCAVQLLQVADSVALPQDLQPALDAGRQIDQQVACALVERLVLIEAHGQHGHDPALFMDGESRRRADCLNAGLFDPRICWLARLVSRCKNRAIFPPCRSGRALTSWRIGIAEGAYAVQVAGRSGSSQNVECAG
ncbi:hypothetical protein GALL_437350 [mine drainage metagenome]|uniref:Uncharacterized protein n=1 Tax=mine drainage metagenome TaxID=410659 RepID=A0A1J5PSZ2_9ZZZZ